MKNTTQREKPQIVTIPQLIAMQILPARAVRRIYDEQRLPSIKIGTRRYVNLDVFLQYLENGERVAE